MLRTIVFERYQVMKSRWVFICNSITEKHYPLVTHPNPRLGAVVTGSLFRLRVGDSSFHPFYLFPFLILSFHSSISPCTHLVLLPLLLLPKSVTPFIISFSLCHHLSRASISPPLNQSLFFFSLVSGMPNAPDSS